ncbi:MAG: hypothetical protein QOE11_1143 [Solirubrobacteraceae bacterium]|nr:hypothetical protein [Solirubrobacteraceae bacterium]
MDQSTDTARNGRAADELHRRLERAERLHRVLLDCTAQGILGLDADGTLTFVNPAALRLLGRQESELLGRPVDEAVADARPIHAALAQGTTEHRAREQFLRRDGTRLEVEYTATPLVCDAGVEGAVVAFADISARHEAESALARYAERLVSLRGADLAATDDEPLPPPPTPAQIIERATALARDQLGMQIAFVSEIADGHEVVRAIAGETPGLVCGVSAPLEESYCRGVMAGELPNIIPDAANDERVRDLAQTRELGVGAYIGVPLQLPGGRVYGMLCCLSHQPAPGLDERDLRFLQTFAGIVADQLAREELEARAARLQGVAATTQALLSALEARDEYTGNHSESVVALAHDVAGELALSGDEVAAVEQVALLHDVGKVGVPDSVLQKPGPLDELEWQIMREHPAIAERIVVAVPGLAHLAPAVRAEHERWDGGGYPDGLVGEAIPLVSRIALCCDAYDAMTSDRPYRAAMTREQAVGELTANAGGQFDPQVVTALVAVLARRPSA